MYSTTSKTAQDVCKVIGFIYTIHFVEAMRRGDSVYVRGTAGKPHEFDALRDACESAGYIYTGLMRGRDY